ncbi:MAG: hypothetical protein DRP42_02355 [Tenericutes bacterium]|nr:MAG: hypothetical protein DRP42_02355 [Mycoplasmatota bacterium]
MPSVRYTHTLSVATHAKRLADKSSFCSPKLAYKAGLAHDIFKYENDRIMTNTIEAHPDYDIPPMKVFHSYYAAI